MAYLFSWYLIQAAIAHPSPLVDAGYRGDVVTNRWRVEQTLG
ncbi:hypothetical protein VB712_16640 [Spirulina sp. CCNP1310]|nr:hypothetical protein [Spirulina sp. CCNP1310]MEA5420859.1 hypothetical protein [Spirulina sp. CCNP1310]